MSLEQQDANEVNGNITPSTASRVKPAPVENAFPTPPRREASESQQSGRRSPAAGRLFGTNMTCPSPREHKSIEALRAIFSRSGYNSGRSSAADYDKPTRKEVSQKKSQLFDQAFAVRDSYYSAKERVARDSLIVVELKLNCAIEQEKSFLNDFQLLLSETYYRPCQNIMISVNTNHHIIMGTSQDPAYFMIITALSPEVASLKNLRATKLTQEFLPETLNIPTNRGIVLFNTIKEEDFGTNTVTLEDEIARLDANDKRNMSMRSRQSARNKRSSTLGTSEAVHVEDGKPAVQHSSEDLDDDDFAFEKPVRMGSDAGKRLQGKKSFIMSLWKKN